MNAASDRGRLIRFDVQVEKNLAIDSDDAARLIERVLNDRRSWRGTGRWRFQLVSSASEATLHAYIVTPGTTDRLCVPLLTRGEVSCQNGNKVVLNAKRWMLGADSYGVRRRRLSPVSGESRVRALARSTNTCGARAAVSARR